MKLLADCGEPAELVPAVPEPAEVQEALRTVPVETRNAAAATPEPPDGTQRCNRELALDVGVLRTEGEQLVELGGTVAHFVELIERVLGRDVVVEVDEFHRDFVRALPLGREVLARDVAVHPVVATELHGVLDRKAVVHRDGIGVAGGLAVRRERFSQDASKRFAILRPAERDVRIDIARQSPKNCCLKLDVAPSYLGGGSMIGHGCSSFSAFGRVLAYLWLRTMRSPRACRCWLQLLTYLD